MAGAARLKDIVPDSYLFPDYGETLAWHFSGRAELFFDSILREDRPVVDLLTADYTFVNEPLAKHYDIPNVKGVNFRRVTLAADSPRRGLLGKGASCGRRAAEPHLAGGPGQVGDPEHSWHAPAASRRPTSRRCRRTAKRSPR